MLNIHAPKRTNNYGQPNQYLNRRRSVGLEPISLPFESVLPLHQLYIYHIAKFDRY